MQPSNPTPKVDRITKQLEEFGIQPKKTLAEMKKQLKRAQKQQNTPQVQVVQKGHPFEYYLICDIEATCEQDSGFDYPNEIIEFPVILIESSTMKQVDVFHRMVKPLLHPNLSSFCTELTGITQDTVDHAQPFDIVFAEFIEWLQTYSKPPFQNCIFVTDGPWDLRDFIEKELTYFQIPRPLFMKQIVDIRSVFKNVMGQPGNMAFMLHYLGYEFQGREHCGMDDTVNVSRIFLNIAEKVKMERTHDVMKLIKKQKRTNWGSMRKEKTIVE